MSNHTYSVSSLMVYEACPLQYYTTFVRGVPPPVSRAMRTGTSVHKLIHDHLSAPQLLPPQAEPDALALFNTFARSRFNVPPLAVEKPFRLNRAQGDVSGRIDLVLPGAGNSVEVVDFKSGSAPERGDVERRLQLPLYAHAAANLFGLAPEDVAYTYFFLRDGQELSFAPDREERGAVLHRVDDLIAGIQSGRFDAAPDCACWACERNRRRRARGAAAREQLGRDGAGLPGKG